MGVHKTPLILAKSTGGAGRRRNRPARNPSRRAGNSSGGIRSDASLGPAGVGRPDVVFETQERARLVRESLARLSPEFRDTLVLKEYDGLSCEEIAEVLGVAVGTVKSRLFRAKLELKRHLAAFFASPSSPAD
ncbi:RNA polymerase sigma factor [Chloracidobacterium thermophilum]|uniref:RNA polymerase sigma factor n=1 Tax=Chloracidobacterium thermophilum TaxID=458033 RepID=UPI0009E7B204|nr:sigma-70 family RNA polymerase sigma factor [Chloracidobacterium thermophilum]